MGAQCIGSSEDAMKYPSRRRWIRSGQTVESDDDDGPGGRPPERLPFLQSLDSIRLRRREARELSESAPEGAADAPRPSIA